MPVSRSSAMAGRATFTTVLSRNAIPEPSTVAAITHRAAGVPYLMFGAGTCGAGLIRGRLPAVAEPPDLIQSRLRVLTWNLWWRFGPWQARQPAIIATLRRIDADVIALQETWND